MINTWQDFENKVRDLLDSVLAAHGFARKMSGESEDNGGFFILYEDKEEHRISIGVVKRLVYRNQIRSEFNWIHVDIGQNRLKENLELTPDDLEQANGWKYNTADELDMCLEDIAKRLKIYFETQSKEV